MKKLILSILAFSAVAASAQQKPLKVMLITGGCCHDYGAQTEILKKGIESKLNAVVTQIHSDDKSTTPPLPIYGNPDYAEGYDVVVHDECSAGIKDLETIKAVLKPHLDGVPGVNIHCAMHSYRFGSFGKPLEEGAENRLWFEYLGLQSSGHGPKKPLNIKYVDKKHPITVGLEDWTTKNEELYNNIAVYEGSHVLSTATQEVKEGKVNEAVVTWTSLYGPKKTRVFSTTLGHFNYTVEDERFMELVCRGILWSVDKIQEDGKPVEGYGK